MQKINTRADLKMAILQLENKQATEWLLLNDQILLVRDSLHPIQLFKRSFSEVISSPPLKDNLLGSVLGLTAGFLSKALVIGATTNPVKMLLGGLLQLKVSNTVAKNAGTIGFFAGNLLKFFSKKNPPPTETTITPTEPYREIF